MESADRILARKAEQECKQQQKKDDAKKALEAFYNRRKSALTKRKEQNREEEKKKKDVTNRRQPPLGANRDAIDQARWRHVVSMISPEAMRARGTQLGKMKQLFLSSAHQSYPASPGPMGQKDAAPASGQIHSDSKQGHEHAESAVMQAAVNCAAAGIGSVTLSEHETNVKPTRDSRGTEDDTNGGEAPASGKDNITVDLTSRPEKGDFYD